MDALATAGCKLVAGRSVSTQVVSTTRQRYAHLAAYVHACNTPEDPRRLQPLRRSRVSVAVREKAVTPL
jgi:hypothetical protein